MSIFSKLHKNRQADEASTGDKTPTITQKPESKTDEQDIFVPSGAMISLSEYMESDSLLSEHVVRLNSLIYSPKAQREDFLTVLKCLESELAEYKLTLPKKEHFENILTDIKQLSHLQISNEFTELEQFKSDLQVLSQQFALVKNIAKKSDDALSDEQVKSLFDAQQLQQSSVDELLDDLDSFIEQESKLSLEITNYANTIEELKQRYKFSVDLNGKKSQLIAFGKQLSVRRERLLKTEQILKQRAEVFFPTVLKLHFSFIGLCRYLAAFVERKIELFVDADIGKNPIYIAYNELKENIDSEYPQEHR